MRERTADYNRLMWRLHELVDCAFSHLDTTGDGRLQPRELGWMMEALGERLTLLELAQMFGECKAWGLPNVSKLRRTERAVRAEAPPELEDADREIHFQQETARRLLVEFDQQCGQSTLDPETGSICINLEASDTDISRDELMNMLTTYWTCRKNHDLGFGSQNLKTSSTSEWTLSRAAGSLVRVATQTQAEIDLQKTSCCKRKSKVGGGDSGDDLEGSAVPGWLSDIAKGYVSIDPDQRTPDVFWKTLGTKLEQVVMRAQGKGISAGGDPGSSTDKLAQEAIYAMKTWSIRSIGSSDGLTQPSAFSIGWDLMQVVLLMWVLVSVPFSIAFNVETETFTALWWWELWVDTYFVLDILLSFRTPYYFRGELHYSTKAMAVHYMMSWFIPDILSCASMLQYVTNNDVQTDGSANADGTDASPSRLAKLVRLTKLAKLLRLARMKRSLARLSDAAFERFGGGIMIALGAVGSILKLVGGFMLAMHLIASIYYLIGDSDDGWVPAAFPELAGTEPVPVVERYFQSMMTVALGSFPEETKPNEEVFAIASVLFNGFVFGAVAATFSSIMVELNEPYVAFNGKIDELKSWMRTQRFDVQTQKQVEEFYAAKLSGGGNAGKLIDEAGILHEFIPAPIVDELVMFLYTDLIKRVPIFSSLSDEVVSKLCLNLRPLPAIKGAPVCIEGRIADCMYIVRSGRLQNWENSTTVPMMARCSLSRADDAQYFWSTVYDELGAFACPLPAVYARASLALLLSCLC